MSALKEYNRKPSHAHIPSENIIPETKENQPMGIFSFKNKENKSVFKSYEGIVPKRPSTTQDQFKTNFWKKMINSLVNKLVHTESENEEMRAHPARHTEDIKIEEQAYPD